MRNENRRKVGDCTGGERCDGGDSGIYSGQRFVLVLYSVLVCLCACVLGPTAQICASMRV